MPASVKKPKFNHDLLIHPADLATARALFPTLAEAFYHPELIDYFKQFDNQANGAKRKSRKLGTWAILLGGAAIAMAAIDVAIRVFWERDLAILLLVGLIAAACGLCSAALGAFGTLFGPRKHEWLIDRFMGERARQFHFQSLIARSSPWPVPPTLDVLKRQRDPTRHSRRKRQARNGVLRRKGFPRRPPQAVCRLPNSL